MRQGRIMALNVSKGASVALKLIHRACACILHIPLSRARLRAHLRRAKGARRGGRILREGSEAKAQGLAVVCDAKHARQFKRLYGW